MTYLFVSAPTKASMNRADPSALILTCFGSKKQVDGKLGVSASGTGAVRVEPSAVKVTSNMHSSW